jgi:hypothetical protein
VPGGNLFQEFGKFGPADGGDRFGHGFAHEDNRFPEQEDLHFVPGFRKSKAVRERSDMLVYLRTDSRLNRIRSDSRFPELERKVGIPA